MGFPKCIMGLEMYFFPPLFLKKKAQNFGINRFPDAADFLTNNLMNRKENIEYSYIYTFIE